jgi:hypothetical protein
VVLLSRLGRWILLAAIAAGAGCIGQSPEQAEADALGPDPSGLPEGPLHRPGFPCTRCHGDAWWQQSPSFELAGTIYRDPSGSRGEEGADVVVRDATGRELTVRTNRSGNFYFREGDADLVFPLRVSVRVGEHEQTMRGLIWRERSCSACHRGPSGEASTGPVFVREEAP